MFQKRVFQLTITGRAPISVTEWSLNLIIDFIIIGEAKPAEENDVEATGSQSEMKIESDTRTEAVSDNNSPITDEEKAALAAASAAQ